MQNLILLAAMTAAGNPCGIQTRNYVSAPVVSAPVVRSYSSPVVRSYSAPARIYYQTAKPRAVQETVYPGDYEAIVRQAEATRQLAERLSAIYGQTANVAQRVQIDPNETKMVSFIKSNKCDSCHANNQDNGAPGPYLSGWRLSDEFDPAVVTDIVMRGDMPPTPLPADQRVALYSLAKPLFGKFPKQDASNETITPETITPGADVLPDPRIPDDSAPLVTPGS